MLSKSQAALPFPQMLCIFKRFLVSVVFEKHHYTKQKTKSSSHSPGTAWEASACAFASKVHHMQEREVIANGPQAQLFDCQQGQQLVPAAEAAHAMWTQAK